MVFSAQEQNIPQEQYFHFQFCVKGSLKEFVLLKLFNGNGELLITEHEEISINLPRGLYQLQIFSDEKFEQKLIRLDGNLDMTWANEGSYSSIPANFLQSTEDYYQDAVNQWSRKSTGDNQEIDHNHSSLFIFFRYPNEGIKSKQENVARTMGWRFSLLDSDRNVVYRLYDKKNVREDSNAGWLAFHVKLEPGIYYLIYKGNPKTREIPLYVFPRWQTQFFLTFKKTPIFATTRIQLVRQDNPNELREKETLQLDALLRNLENGIYYVPQSLIQNTADRKWENPILALAVCYAYLLSPEDTNDDLFRIMLRNIEERILTLQNASDLQALRLLAATHFDYLPPHMVLDEPCMFNIGMKVFIEHSIKYPDRITISDKCEEIISNLQNDSAWTSYKPLKKYEGTISERIHEEDNYIKLININEIYSEFLTPLSKSKKDSSEDWLSLSIKSQLMTKKETPLTSTALAMQFQVSQSMVENSIDKIKNEIIDNENPFLLQNSKIEADILKDNIYKITRGNSNNF
jgi:hypothetical protein